MLTLELLELLKLPEVYYLCTWKVFLVECEDSVRDAGLLEVADVNDNPFALLQHLYLLDDVVVVYEDVHLADTPALANEVYFFAAGSFGKTHVISLLVEIQEGIWIHGLLLGGLGVRDVHLVGLAVIYPLCLAVVPH